MADIKQYTFKYLEGLISDYKQMDQHIKARELELLSPWSESDGNIGGGRSSIVSRPTETKGLSIATDKSLLELKRQKQALDVVVSKARPVALDIIELRYWADPRKLTWDGIASQVHYSRSQCFLLRDEFILRLCEELGLL